MNPNKEMWWLSIILKEYRIQNERKSALIEHYKDTLLAPANGVI